MDRGTWARSLYVQSAQEMVELGVRLAQTITAPLVLALSGDLGSGKTTLAKGVISALAHVSPSEVTSPTFQYIHLYQGAECTVAHCDLWRLRGADDFLELGLDEYFVRGIALVEWPERISGLLPADTFRIDLSVVGGGRLVRMSSEELGIGKKYGKRLASAHSRKFLSSRGFDAAGVIGIFGNEH